VAARAAGFFATAVLARKLGADAFGLLGFATAITMYFGVAVTVGFGDIGAREVAKNPERATTIAVDATAVRLLIALGGACAINAVALVFVENELERSVLMLSSLILLPVSLDPGWVYRGLERTRFVGATLFLSQLIYLAGVLILVRFPADVVRVPPVQFAGELLAALVLLAFLSRSGVPRPSFRGGIRLLRQSGLITVTRLLRSLIVTFDLMLLGIMASKREVGLYSAAYRVCLMLTAIAVATHVVFIPAVTRAAAVGPAEVSTVLKRSLALTGAVMLPLVVGGMVLAQPLLSLLFGGDYSSGANALRLLLVSIGLLSLHGTMHYVFVATDRIRQQAGIIGGGAALNVALNLILIPRYSLVGAAAATVASEALILVASAVVLWKRGLRTRGAELLPAALASGVMAMVVSALPDRVPVLLAIPAGGAVYLAVLVSLGGLPRNLPVSGVDSAVAGG